MKTLKRRLLNKYGDRFRYWAKTGPEFFSTSRKIRFWGEDVLGDLLVIVWRNKR